MMIKCIVGATLLISLVSGASLYAGGSLNANPSGVSANTGVDMKAKGFKAILYLFAPDSWISAWNAIPEAGQDCFVQESGDPQNAQLYNSDDIQAIKQQIQTKCQTGATEIGNFLDATEQTFKSLPAVFLADSKAYGAQAQTLGEQFKQLAATGGANIQQQMGSAAFKQKIAQFSTITADFTAKLAAYSDADRQQIAAAFPKLQAFISGDNAVTFLNQVTALYRTLGSATLDANALKTQAQQLKPTLQAIWQQYKTQNADGLKQAGQLLGKDLSQMGTDSMFNAQTDGAINTNGAVNPNSGLKFGGQVSQGSSDISNSISQRVEQGKQQLEAGRDKFQAWAQTAKENTQEGLQQFKEKANQGIQQLKQKVDEFKQEHSANGQASLNGNGAVAGINVN